MPESLRCSSCGRMFDPPDGSPVGRAVCPGCLAEMKSPKTASAGAGGSQGNVLRIGKEELGLVDDNSSPAGKTKGTIRCNRRIEGKTCAICQDEIRLAEEVKICGECKQPFHELCWRENGGCATYGCSGRDSAGGAGYDIDFSISPDQIAPLPQQNPPPLSNPFPPSAARGDQSHPNTGQYVPVRTSGYAIASLVLGLTWLCGIGSILAILFGGVGVTEIDSSNGHITGRGMAVAGIILGIIGTAFTLLSFLAAL